MIVGGDPAYYHRFGFKASVCGVMSFYTVINAMESSLSLPARG